jgi:hypothetical protein
MKYGLVRFLFKKLFLKKDSTPKIIFHYFVFQKQIYTYCLIRVYAYLLIGGIKVQNYLLSNGRTYELPRISLFL